MPSVCVGTTGGCRLAVSGTNGQPLLARTHTYRTMVSPTHQRSGEVWWLSIVRSALEPDSHVVQPRGRAAKDAQIRDPAPALDPTPTLSRSRNYGLIHTQCLCSALHSPMQMKLSRDLLGSL